MSCYLICSLQPCGSPLYSLVRGSFYCFCHFPMWCLWSGAVLYLNDSCFLSFSLICCELVMTHGTSTWQILDIETLAGSSIS